MIINGNALARLRHAASTAGPKATAAATSAWNGSIANSNVVTKPTANSTNVGRVASTAGPKATVASTWNGYIDSIKKPTAALIVATTTQGESIALDVTASQTSFTESTALVAAVPPTGGNIALWNAARQNSTDDSPSLSVMALAFGGCLFASSNADLARCDDGSNDSLMGGQHGSTNGSGALTRSALRSRNVEVSQTMTTGGAAAHSATSTADQLSSPARPAKKTKSKSPIRFPVRV